MVNLIMKFGFTDGLAVAAALSVNKTWPVNFEITPLITPVQQVPAGSVPAGA